MQSKTHINKGLYIAAILIVFNVITHFTKTLYAEWTIFVFASIIILGVATSVYLYQNSIENAEKFSTLFAYGFKVAAVVTCIYFLYVLLEINFIFPEYINEKLGRSVTEMKQQGLIDEASFDANYQKGMLLGKKVETYKYIAGTIMSTLFLGVLGSVLGTVISKQKSN